MMAVLLSSLTDAELLTFADANTSDLTPLESELIKRLRQSVEKVEVHTKERDALEHEIDSLSKEIVRINDYGDSLLQRIKELEQLEQP